MSSEPVIEARALGKAYPIYRRPEDRLKQLLFGSGRRFYEEYWAVRDVNLGVRRGENVGIIGRNGSGKSTLLQMICGTLRPSTGQVRVRGRVAAMLELGTGFNPEFTGRENIRVGASVLGLSAAEIESRFDAIAGFADIGAFIDQPLKHYSNGMHARLAFAVCANVDADVLIIDEILSVGDAAFQQKCMRFLNRFRLHGTMLFVSHDEGAILKLCDRVLWLEEGQMRALGDAKEICRLYLAAQAEDAAENADGFRISSRGEHRLTPAAGELATVQLVPSAHGFEFDPDEEWDGSRSAEIDTVELRAIDGTNMPVAAGGEEVELRVNCRASESFDNGVVAFVWRDRLGQVLFSDDSPVTNSVSRMKQGHAFVARFFFRLPYLSNGAYSIEAFLFEQTNSGPRPVARRRDAFILHVQSRHIFQQGLLNIGMRGVRLRALPRETTRSETVTDDPIADVMCEISS